jgi:hypothetical protein
LLGIGEGYGFKDGISQFCLSRPLERQFMIGLEPGLTGMALQETYVGAVGEHHARCWGLHNPVWTDDRRRFMVEPHFPEGFEFLNLILLRDSPIAFRRLIFRQAGSLGRVQSHEFLRERVWTQAKSSGCRGRSARLPTRLWPFQICLPSVNLPGVLALPEASH